ncbi:uncharacterized protein N7500_003033 [Penicillium coprophilum]|uniref:uncharacterized protein n=1 Tax=Penicillium coprophilum TaxID=36646 RepID=UPI0023A345A0|nr:uncharacterized protein N7500_003033 [Penicillium coprophilum]KAJ5170250.1 hypothetical protein N7500_003033 [Penicillium coprophilum]
MSTKWTDASNSRLEIGTQLTPFLFSRSYMSEISTRTLVRITYLLLGDDNNALSSEVSKKISQRGS